jgi:hypothetical protein
VRHEPNQNQIGRLPEEIFRLDEMAARSLFLHLRKAVDPITRIDPGRRSASMAPCLVKLKTNSAAPAQRSRNAGARKPSSFPFNLILNRTVMKMKLRWLVLAGLLLLTVNAFSQDTNFWIFVCFGQSNMEGFPGVQPQDKTNVDDRFQVLATVDFPKLGRQKGHWYPAVPPLCRPSTGLGPADYFGRTLVANLPKNIRVGVVVVAVAGCKIDLFEETHYQAYASNAPSWMKNIIKQYDGNPYQYLVAMAKLAQKDGVIKGILLHQGESNTSDRQWPNTVKGVYDDLIKDLNLNAEEVPLLAGEVVNADQHGACASMNKIIDDLPKTIPNSYVISSAGCTAIPPQHLHFTPAGYRELGKRYAEKMLSLLGYKIAEPE